MNDPAIDLVNHPPHYTSHPSGVECIEIVRHMNFNLGNVMKYIWRADLKGEGDEDLEKALFYLKDEIKRRKKRRSSAAARLAVAAIKEYEKHIHDDLEPYSMVWGKSKLKRRIKIK